MATIEEETCGPLEENTTDSDVTLHMQLYWLPVHSVLTQFEKRPLQFLSESCLPSVSATRCCHLCVCMRVHMCMHPRPDS